MLRSSLVAATNGLAARLTPLEALRAAATSSGTFATTPKTRQMKTVSTVETENQPAKPGYSPFGTKQSS